ncbi:hypothetical protein NONO_c36530 [Nocardia nova SH22a]|uniref:PhzF family phenazine biosynthesis protein n=1 Tax=Nocardia nova SH22a TaxID=1415166 RepID=W5TGH8_9NOCA|nr:hypothetical protein [Nocardia nova]AHH18440.1 hypothetical protein NONO_c36530 [Nocardia nova SH22a]
MTHWHRHKHSEPAAEQAPERDSAQIEILRVFTADDGQGGIPVGLIRRRDVAETDPRALAVRCGVDCLGLYDDPADGAVTVELFGADGPLPRSSAGCLALGWWLAAQHTPVTTVRTRDGAFTVAQSSHLGWVHTDPEAGAQAVLHQIADADRIATVTSSELPEHTNCVWAYSPAESSATVRIKRMTRPDSEFIAAASTALTTRLGHGITVVEVTEIHVVTKLDEQGRVLLGGRVREDHVVVL